MIGNKMERPINKVIVHCSASDLDGQKNAQAIEWLHTSSKNKTIQWGNYTTTGKDFSDIGYHFIIEPNGSIVVGRPIAICGAHCRGENYDSIGICLAGDKEFTPEQFESYKILKAGLKSRYNLKDDNFYPHNHFDQGKSCPNFDIRGV